MAGTSSDAAGRLVVFYDGVCALCNRTVRFFMNRDRHRVLSFAPLQGPTFEALRRQVRLPPGSESVIYVRGYGTPTPSVYARSEATLQILRDLGGVCRVVSWARIIPRFIRDTLYDWIARRRYRWFGRYEACRRPETDDATRLLP